MSPDRVVKKAGDLTRGKKLNSKNVFNIYFCRVMSQGAPCFH